MFSRNRIKGMELVDLFQDRDKLRVDVNKKMDLLVP
jgi:hypothetical protein